MKKTLMVLLVLFVVVGVLYYLNKNLHTPMPSTVTTKTNQLSLQLSNTNTVAADFSNNYILSPIAAEMTNKVINGLMATNLEQWKTMIKGLKYSDTFYRDRDSWVMEQRNPDKAIPVLLEANGQTISYKVGFIDVDAYKRNGQIIDVQMHTPNMNIDETKELGLQLCSMFGIDPNQFSAWCDKVGNKWLDAPLYATGNRYYVFEVHNTFNDEKPWFINFIIQHP